MKKAASFAAAAALAIGLSAGVASAEETNFTACTADGKTATLKADVAGSLGDVTVKDLVQQAFTKTAKGLNGAALTGQEGYVTFMTNLQEAAEGKQPSADIQFRIMGAPAVGEPACKP